MLKNFLNKLKTKNTEEVIYYQKPTYYTELISKNENIQYWLDRVGDPRFDFNMIQEAIIDCAGMPYSNGKTISSIALLEYSLEFLRDKEPNFERFKPEYIPKYFTREIEHVCEYLEYHHPGEYRREINKGMKFVKKYNKDYKQINNTEIMQWVISVFSGCYEYQRIYNIVHELYKLQKDNNEKKTEENITALRAAVKKASEGWKWQEERLYPYRNEEYDKWKSEFGRG